MDTDNIDLRSLNLIFLEFLLVSNKHECDGSSEYACLQPSLEACAIACQNRSSMFLYGRAERGTERCYGSKCRCYCEIHASKEGSCTTIAHSGYDLYKYASIGG